MSRQISSYDTFSPELIVQSIPFTTKSRPSLYLVEYLLNFTIPLSGQSWKQEKNINDQSLKNLIKSYIQKLSWTVQKNV